MSLNAVIGDDGIVTRAKEANILNSCAILSEYLNEEYVISELDDIIEYNSDGVPMTAVEKMIKRFPNMFYSSGSYDYVTTEYVNPDTSEVSILKIRLINKSNLKDEIKKQLIGGEAENNQLQAYKSLRDVYGVTDNLEVFYCSDGLYNSIGASVNNCGILDSAKVLYNKNSGVAKAIAESTGKTVTDNSVSDLRSITSLTISADSGIKDLNFLYDMPKITSLTLLNYSGSLKGIEYLGDNLIYLYINNTNKTTNIDYVGLSKTTGIKELYFYMPNDTEVSKLCEEMSKASYPKLATLGFYGLMQRDVYDFYYSCTNYNYNPYLSSLTTLEYLDKLTDITKSAVKVLYVNNNNLTTLKGIENFSNINSLYLCNNKITDSVDSQSGKKIYGMTSYIEKMAEITNLYIGYNSLLTQEDFNRIKDYNKKISTLSMAGCTSITNLDMLVSLSNLKYVQAVSNANLIMTDTALLKIGSLSYYYFDNKYATAISLANVGSEVWLSSDVTDEEFLRLKGKTQINTLEIGGCKNLKDETLQTVLGSLTGLTRLYADNTNLDSLNFIGNNTSLCYISVYNTNVSDLTNLKYCTGLRSLRISTPGLNLKPYSKIISDMCARGYHNECHVKCGSYSDGGLNAPVELVNTLNGTETNPNMDFTCYSSYCGFNYGMATIDFTYTGLKKIGIIYEFVTIKVPSGFSTFSATECAGGAIDYSNVTKSDTYKAYQVNSKNYDSFLGYNYVASVANSISIIGTNTTTLRIGTRDCGDIESPELDYNINEFVEKAPNVTNMEIYGLRGISDLDCLKTLKLTNLKIQYSTIGNINIKDLETNLGNSITTLSILNSTFNKLDGLSNLPNIQTLNLSGNQLENYITVSDGNGGTKTVNTCEYIVESLPNVKNVYLNGNLELTDFSALLNNGFRETSNDSHNFVK